jgi:hypothetical protein
MEAMSPLKRSEIEDDGGIFIKNVLQWALFFYR